MVRQDGVFSWPNFLNWNAEELSLEPTSTMALYSAQHWYESSMAPC